ncbi:MAG: formate dehydrogenase accessory sulfurtransferase FdhD [Acidobacteriota bacterium]|nr:formate dehydrogenase accessory sulfurtransferase FdhD [Acidobacteriota bacterium]
MAKTASGMKSEKFETEIQRVSNNVFSPIENDTLAVEEPLEIRVGFRENGKTIHKAISITMRTPENDHELAAGFLFTEGILHSKNQIESIKHCGKFPNNRNTVRLDLSPETTIDFKKLERNFYTTSSCGVCGKSSIEALTTGAKPLESIDFPRFSAATIHELPTKIREHQKVFDKTGGLHAAALFDISGNLIDLKEDVGRHNAVDKLIGAQFLAGNLPLDDKILFLSGRASFELLQKAVMAHIPIVCAVGAPSSLAVEAARNFGVTLLGFVRDGRFNIYNGSERLNKQGL